MSVLVTTAHYEKWQKVYCMSTGAGNRGEEDYEVGGNSWAVGDLEHGEGSK